MSQNKLEILASPDEPTLITHRTVDAPRTLVWDCFTKPEHLKRWMGPKSCPMVSCEMDFRVGGKYRMVHRMGDKELGFHGEYLEIVRPERCVRTFVFEPHPDAAAHETLVLEEENGKTRITTITLHKTMEARDGHLKSGVEKGMIEGYARLDELVAAIGGGSAAHAG